MIAALTGMGLSAAAGLNAYIPFLVVALIAKYTDFIVLPSAYGWMESWWAIGIGTALLLTEVVVDKVPAVDTVNDAVQTFIRPSMGGLLAAATAGAAELDNSAWMAQNPWMGVLLGVVVAGVVHVGQDGGPARGQRRDVRHGCPGALDRRGRRLARPEPDRPVRARAGGRRAPRGPGGARLAGVAGQIGPPAAGAEDRPTGLRQ